MGGTEPRLLAAAQRLEARRVRKVLCGSRTGVTVSRSRRHPERKPPESTYVGAYRRKGEGKREGTPLTCLARFPFVPVFWQVP